MLFKGDHPHISMSYSSQHAAVESRSDQESLPEAAMMNGRERWVIIGEFYPHDAAQAAVRTDLNPSLLGHPL